MTETDELIALVNKWRFTDYDDKIEEVNDAINLIADLQAAITASQQECERLETALRIIAKDDCSAAGEIARKALEKGE